MDFVKIFHASSLLNGNAYLSNFMARYYQKLGPRVILSFRFFFIEIAYLNQPPTPPLLFILTDLAITKFPLTAVHVFEATWLPSLLAPSNVSNKIIFKAVFRMRFSFSLWYVVCLSVLKFSCVLTFFLSWYYFILNSKWFSAVFS